MEEQKFLEGTGTGETPRVRDQPSNCQKVKALAAVLAGLFFATVASSVCVQLLNRAIPDFQLNTMRFAVAFTLQTIVLLIFKRLPKIPRHEIPYLALFGIFILVDNISIYAAVTFLPLSTCQCIIITSSIVSGLILFAVFYNDRVTVRSICLALLCACGVVLVVQPPFIFPSDSEKYTVQEFDNSSLNTTTQAMETKETHGSIATTTLGYVLAFGCGLNASLSMLIFKRRPYLGQHMGETMFWAFLISVLISAVPMVIYETITVPKTWFQVLLVSIHCIGCILSWPSYIYALRYVSGNTINIMYSTSVVLVLVPQYTVLSSIHPGHRNWMEVLGVVLVLLGASFGSVLEIYSNRLKKRS